MDHGRDERAVLHDRLDALWTQYLHLLDEYTAAQTAIKKDMAAGFFSLTQANFKTSGRRYGQDHYDDRAKATTRARVEDGDRATRLHIVRMEPVENAPATDPEEDESAKAREESEARTSDTSQGQEAQQLPSPTATPEPAIEEDQAAQRSTTGEDNAPAEPSARPTSTSTSPPSTALQTMHHDPIRWFGILVPRTLRQAQESFRQAVQSERGMPQAINASRGLRETEAEIRKLRKAMRKAERDSGMARAADWTD